MNKDRRIGFGFLVFCALIWFAVIPWQIEGAEEAILPKLAVIAIAVPALIMFAAKPRESAGSGFDPALFLRITLPCMLLILAYVIGIIAAGFYPASAVFLVLALLLFRERRARVFILVPCAVLGSIYAIITHFLNFQLPQSIFF